MWVGRSLEKLGISPLTIHCCTPLLGRLFSAF
jgi:hypothetical protein